jgi:hypothetical protein
VAGWLSEEWVEGVAGLVGLLPRLPAMSGAVVLSVSTAPRKEVHVHWRYDEGQPADGGGGLLEDAHLTLSIASVDAADVVSGRVEPSVAFMRGRLKASGDGALLLGFLESTGSPDFEGWRKKVAALGDVPIADGPSKDRG